MEKFEALWAYQEEDMKADAIAAAIKRSPTRQKLEKARDFILDRQKQYKQIEEDVGAMVDRKDIIAQAIERSRDQLKALQSRYEANPPQTGKETEANDKLSRSVRLEAANAKKTFDQLKADYEEESKSKKGELEAQRAKAKELMDQVDPKLLEEYETIKKHISPPVARLAHGHAHVQELLIALRLDLMPAIKAHHQKTDAGAYAADSFIDESIERIKV